MKEKRSHLINYLTAASLSSNLQQENKKSLCPLRSLRLKINQPQGTQRAQREF
jgi:hypothetical protein